MRILLFILIAMLVFVGCYNNKDSPDTILEESGDNEVTNEVLQMINNSEYDIGLESADETPDSELINEVMQMINDSEYDIDLELAAVKNDMTVEEYAERLKAHFESFQTRQTRLVIDQLNRMYLRFMVDGFYIPADDDKDWQEIERFIFIYNEVQEGYVFFLDRMYGRIYFNPHTSEFDELLEHFDFYIDFADEDLDELIKTLDKSGLRNWDRQNKSDRENTSSEAWWKIGILFSDGTIRRWSGEGITGDTFPLSGQFAILIDYVKSAGDDIINRHKQNS
jgi:hypothetical protein